MKESAKSLEDVHGSVDTTRSKGVGKKMLAFLGPAYLVSVGYMDPGNWATDIEGGSRFGYALIWVLVMSNLMALLLQSLSARLGVVAGLDLAQASRYWYPKRVNVILWFFAEIAIAACDLAEVLGMAIGLKLLFHIPLLAGVLITVADTFLLLILQRFGIRKMEAFIIGLISVIGMAFIAELIYSHPSMNGIAAGVIPTLPDGSLAIVVGIIGATVMPHNLYLHSSLVQTRKIERTRKGLLSAIRYNILDSAIALNLALFVNAAILILAAAAFHHTGRTDVASISDAHQLLSGILGTSVAPVLFAVALIAAGQSSTLTGTLSGQIVMEGYLNLRLQPWLRRLITRLIAIIPAVLTILISGENETEGLLVISQIVLSLQLGFAVVPLIHFVSSKKLMGEFAISWKAYLPAWLCAGIIISLNANYVREKISELLQSTANPALIWCTAVPVAILAGIFLIYIIAQPFVFKYRESRMSDPHQPPADLVISEQQRYRHIAVCVDFSVTDTIAINHAIQQGGTDSRYTLIHIVETAVARVMQDDAHDNETSYDEQVILQYAENLRSKGYTVETQLGFGHPKMVIPKIVSASGCDLLVMGAHGHRVWKDILFGTTVESVRHNVKVPVLIVRK